MLKPNGSSELPAGIKYRAFLSYRSSDRKLAEWLHAKLESYRVPRRLVGKPGLHGPVPRRIGPLFTDRAEARAAHDLHTSIREFLAQSQQLIVLCTPAAAQPESWVPREIEIFREVRGDASIHAIIGDGEPPACFPQPLLTRSSDGTVHAPLAPDLRSRKQGGDGRRRAIIKLIAGLAGVDFDDLWRREARRRRLRYVLLGIAGVAVLILAGTWFQRTEAARLGSALITADKLDVREQELADLMLIAAGPPTHGAITKPDPRQVDGLRAIARRNESNFAGTIAKLHEDVNTDVVAVSQDRELIFSSDDSKMLHVWSTSQNRLMARISLDADDWLDRSWGGPYRTHEDVVISGDGHRIATVYRGDQETERVLASWQLEPDGTCSSACLPRHFAFAVGKPGEGFAAGKPGPDWSISRDSYRSVLTMSPDGERALYSASGRRAYAIEVTRQTATPLSPDESNRCQYKIPEPAPRAEVATESNGEDEPAIPLPDDGSQNERRDFFWPDAEGQVIARLHNPDGILSFHSMNASREVGSLIIPGVGTRSYDYSSTLEVVFLDHARKALVANNDSPAGGISSSRVLGVFDLEHCSFDAWPEIDPAALVTKGSKNPDVRAARLDSVSSFVASADGRFVAALLKLRFPSYWGEGIPLIYDVSERKPIAVTRLQEAARALDRTEALMAGGADYPFLGFTYSKLVPIRRDGSLGPITDPSAQNEQTYLKSKTVPIWELGEGRTTGLRKWNLLDPALSKPSRMVDFYGGIKPSVAISNDHRTIATGASAGVIYLQPVDASPAAARRLAVDPAFVEEMRFSPRNTVFAVYSTGGGDYGPYAVSAWHSETGKYIGSRKFDDRVRLIAVTDDGRVLLRSQDAIVATDLGSHTSTKLIEAPNLQFITNSSQTFIADRTGKTWSVDGALRVQPLTTQSFLEERNRSLMSIDAQARFAHVSDERLEYFLDLRSGYAREFLRVENRGPSMFYGDRRFAIVVPSRFDSLSEIQIWDPVDAVRLASFRAPSRDIQALWFDEKTQELRAVDKNGRVRSWALDGDYESELKAACSQLTRKEFTDAEMTAYPFLRARDRKPCSRIESH